jgi:hypothetical protein
MVAAILCRAVPGAVSATGSAAAHGQSVASKSSFRQRDSKAHPDLFVWTDTCHVYVLRDGDAALLTA